MKHGCFIVVEALDGVGKSTLVRDLAAALGGHAMSTPGEGIAAVRGAVLEGLGPDQLARCVFYASTVIAQGHRARAIVEDGRFVVMDRYWASTCAYARARGVTANLTVIEAIIPRPDVIVHLVLEEKERLRRLFGRGDLTDADHETLAPAFRDRVLTELSSRATVEVDVTGADRDEAVRRVLAALANAVPA